MVPDDTSSDHSHVVIFGGGFAGVRAARELERRLPASARCTLVNADNAHTFTPLLPEVVAASMLPGHVVAPLRQLVRRTRVVTGEVVRIDSRARRLQFADGATLGGDHLILACGMAADRTLLPGMVEHTLALKTVGDALEIRNAAIRRLEELDRDGGALNDPRARFAVIGGGFSGVELAGQINDLVRAGARYYPNVDAERLRVTVLHDGARILPEVPPDLSAFAARRMRKAGIELHTGIGVREVDADGVVLNDGARATAATVIATIGTAPHPVIRELDVDFRGKRLSVNGDLSVPGRPGLWAAGDCAAVPNALDGGVLPPTAQAADRAARHLAENVRRDLAGERTRAIVYRSKGFMATIGDQRAVAKIGRLRIAGRPAWLIWRVAYLGGVPTLWRKLRVGVEWLWACLFPADIAHLRFRTSDQDSR